MGSITVRYAGWLLSAAITAFVSFPAHAQCVFLDGFETDNPCVSGGGCPRPVPSPTASAQIAAARAAADGVVDLPVQGAIVSYAKPLIGSDAAGFFVQAAAIGPALFVAVDPATLAPRPAAGDLVSFRITQMATSGALRQAAAIVDWSVAGSGARLECLLQEVSSASDLVTGVADYESEFVALSGTIAGGFASAGSGFEAAQLSTLGVPADANLRLRVPTVVRDAIDLVNSCSVTVAGTPLWRFGSQSQPSAWAVPDVSALDCPAPTVVSAQATSANGVRVNFDRRIAPASVVASGAQFSFDNGLLATAATVDGRSAVLTTTSQAAGTTYTVAVAGGVLDLQGKPVATPNTAQFSGFRPLAVLRITEANANINGGCDLVELRAVTGGSMAGIALRERDAAVFTFPDFQVQANDLVVVHFNRPSVTCNPGGALGETLSPSQEPRASYATNYDTAYDWHINDTGITSTDNVLTVYSSLGTIMDAVFLANDTTGTAAAGTETQAAAVAAVNEWQLVGGGQPPGGYFDEVFRVNAVQDLDATGTTAAGVSIQRNTNTDSNDLLGWTMATSTFGVLNAGETPF